jgi:hypothetical protein
MTRDPNRVEDRLIGMIDAKYARIDKKIQWLFHQGKTPQMISHMLEVGMETVLRAIEKEKL